VSQHDQAIIDEFRANDGEVGGWFRGAPMLLLHTTGARTGIKRVIPLMSQPIEQGWAIFASKGGADENPGWYHNLLAEPATTIEVGSEELAVVAREAEGPEYERIWTQQKAAYPAFAEYERKTKRERIPVIILERTT
jgi:deazaflavin-dependent oxidoreductase (nitroreductase family)